MSATTLQWLTVSGCLLAGALAGIDLDRLVVRFPAWRRLGAAAWAAYSRQADLTRQRQSSAPRAAPGTGVGRRSSSR
jgi:hypothetical protein